MRDGQLHIGLRHWLQHRLQFRTSDGANFDANAREGRSRATNRSPEASDVIVR